MAIAFRCTGCRHAFRVHNHLAGKRIKCAQCGDSLIVPSESTHESENATWNDDATSHRVVTPVAEAAPPPPRPPSQTSGYSAAVEDASSALGEVAEAPASHIRRRRRRGMPLYGWAIMLLGIAACVVLAVIAFKNEVIRIRSGSDDDRVVSASKLSRDASPSEKNETATVEPSQRAPLSGTAVDEPSTADTPAVTAATAAVEQNARERGEAALQKAMARSGGDADEGVVGDIDQASKAKADGEIRPNQPVVVRRTTRLRDESDKESFVHDRTEGRFLKFEEGMARVALEIRIGDEVTGRMPARDLDFGHPVDLDDVDAIRALKAAGAKLASDRIGYIERLECPFKMTDELLEHCAKLPRLVAINANFSGVSDAGLAHLKGHNRLKELLLSQTSITDAGLAHLATIATLEKLDLEETKITDAGLAHLYALDKLKQVALRKTAVTDNGVAELKKNRALKSVKF